jgi:hypothetical protein
MKTRLQLLASLILINTCAFAQTIWNGPTITFTKSNYADWTLQVNQDRITSNVWITRADEQGIFNIKQEPGGYTAISPKDTEWAYGTTANIGSLTFATWKTKVAGDPPSMVGKDMVVHLITENIYIDIKFTSWTAGSGPGSSNGGGFTYRRSTDPGLSTDEFSIKNFTIYPNPGNSEIKLNLFNSATQVAVQVFDMLGKEVYSKTEYESPINVSSWAKGIYLVRVSDFQGAQIKPFVKN